MSDNIADTLPNTPSRCGEILSNNLKHNPINLETVYVQKNLGANSKVNESQLVQIKCRWTGKQEFQICSKSCTHDKRTNVPVMQMLTNDQNYRIVGSTEHQFDSKPENLKDRLGSD